MRKLAAWSLAVVLLAAPGVSMAQEGAPEEPDVDVEVEAGTDAGAADETVVVDEEGGQTIEFFEQEEEAVRKLNRVTFKVGLHNFLESSFFSGPGNFPSEDDLMGPNFEIEYDLRFHEHYSFAVSGGLFEGDHRSRDGSKLKLDVYHVEGHARLHSGPRDFGDFFAGAGVTFMFLDIEGATRDPAINFGALNRDDTSEIGYGAFIEFGWEIPVHENINIVVEDRLGIDRTSTDLNLPGQKSSTGWFTGNLFQVGLQVAF